MTLTASLTNRIFLGTAALLVVAIGVAVFRVNVSVTARSEIELQRGLTDAAALVEASTRAQVDRFERDARLIASLPVLRGAVATADAPTVQPIAEQYQAILHSDVLVVIDTTGRVLAATGRFGADPSAVSRALAARPASESGSWFWAYPGGALLMTAVPMEFLGTLVVGTSLDQGVVDRLGGLTRSDIALVTGHDVIVTTLPAADAASLMALRQGGPSTDVRLAGGDYATRDLRLASAGVAGADLVAVVLRARTEQRAFLVALQRDIAITGLVAVMIATGIGYAIARTVTRPIRAVTATMREMAATGSLAGELPPPGAWDDEDARVLASTFRQMTASIDRFQREMTQRERLSALGRLSAVVAHEVRNPLMIITGALRTLRRAEPGPDGIQAADSIEEEVARLNRVVADVLDFAKPVAIVNAPADLAVIGRAAVAAVEAGPDRVAVRLEAGAAVLPVVTDSERLRTVLVNLLMNAQQAVRDRADGQRPPVILRIQPLADGGARLLVIDEGVGVPAEVHGRAFEPFFTTKRSGSGLGLAIARNIIDGLGGSIALRGDRDRGTTIEVRLPGPPTDVEGRITGGTRIGTAG